MKMNLLDSIVQPKSRKGGRKSLRPVGCSKGQWRRYIAYRSWYRLRMKKLGIDIDISFEEWTTNIHNPNISKGKELCRILDHQQG